MPLELESELVEVPDPHLRLIRPSGDCMVPIAGGPDPVARLGELEVLYEFNSTLDLLLHCSAFALFLDGTFASKPVW